MKIVATVEARMTSSRLPGKVLLPAAGKPMLSHLISRVKQTPGIDEIVLATTVNAADDVLVDLASEAGIGVFRGSENDVMSRVLGAAKTYKADLIVEITADCPLIDPAVIHQTMQLYLHNSCDYASNVIIRSYPIGMDTQVYSTAILEKSFAMTDHPLDREHVTRHIRQNPDIFRQLHLVSHYREFWPDLAITLDEPSDYELLRSIIEYFMPQKPDFSCEDIMNILKNVHPEWQTFNQEVKRKGLN